MCADPGQRIQTNPKVDLSSLSGTSTEIDLGDIEKQDARRKIEDASYEFARCEV